MLSCWITAAYLVRLAAPIAPLVVGSSGDRGLDSLISKTGSGFPATAAQALLIAAACLAIMTTGEWFGSRHERHL